MFFNFTRSFIYKEKNQSFWIISTSVSSKKNLPGNDASKRGFYANCSRTLSRVESNRHRYRWYAQGDEKGSADSADGTVN